jgi:hypothetical protein
MGGNEKAMDQERIQCLSLILFVYGNIAIALQFTQTLLLFSADIPLGTPYSLSPSALLAGKCSLAIALLLVLRRCSLPGQSTA